MKTRCILICLLFLMACKEKGPKNEPGTIYLNPDEAQTLTVSDFFDDLKVFSFSGVLYRSVENFVRCSDRYIANLTAFSGDMLGPSLYAFDLKGDSLYSIGSKGRGPGEYMYIDRFIVNKDHTIGVFSFEKYLKFAPDGKFLYEQHLTVSDSSSIQPLYIFNDSILAYEPLTANDFIVITDKIQQDLDARTKEKYNLNLYSLKTQKRLHAYSPLKDFVGLKFHNFSYVTNDTLCFFIEFDNCIYNVFQDTILPRYYVNRGKHDAWTPSADYRSDGRFKGLGDMKCRETDRYVIGQYIRDRFIHYYFIYDKVQHKTYNFNIVDDDLLGIGITNNKMLPSAYFREWMTGAQFDNDYLYFSFAPQQFVKIINKIKGKMDTVQWETYKQKYPDLIGAYEQIDDESSDPIIIGYHFK